MAFDILDVRFHYREIGILHTHPHSTTVTASYQKLLPVLERDYPQTLHWYELAHPDGTPLIDITDTLTTNSYYTAMMKILREYRMRYEPIHLLIAGGRKAMSVYAAMASALLFGENDTVWTVIARPNLMQAGMFHAPAGTGDHVTIVEIPLPISRLIPGEISRQSVEHSKVGIDISPRQRFLDKLTPRKLVLVELITQMPYASNEEICATLHKSVKTVEAQLSSIYNKLVQPG